VSALTRHVREDLAQPNTDQALLFHRGQTAPNASASYWQARRIGKRVVLERRASLRSCLGNKETRRLPMEFAIAQADLLQFEVIRTIAASLISVAIFLLWLVAISRH
jgi:hypothetical protein